MKLFSNILVTTFALVISSAQAAQVDCLDEMRFNLESMCRNECSNKLNDSVAFSVSYAEDDNSCRCFSKGKEYRGTGDRKSQLTCYSMTKPRTTLIGYGDCSIAGDSAPAADSKTTTHLVLKKCPRQEPSKIKDAHCLDEKRYNLESMCRSECAKHDSVAFSVSYAEDDDSCRCYPKIPGFEGTFNGTKDRESRLTCYSMDGKKTRVLDYGDCTVDGVVGDYVKKYTLKRCPASGDRLRRRVLA